MTLSGPETLFLLLCGHALGDFSLQNEWVASNKERRARPKELGGGAGKPPVVWPYLLTAHALHHGLMVFLITQKLSLGIIETVAHWLTDFGKGEGLYGFHTDQIIHVGAKVVWTALIVGQFV